MGFSSIFMQTLCFYGAHRRLISRPQMVIPVVNQTLSTSCWRNYSAFWTISPMSCMPPWLVTVALIAKVSLAQGVGMSGRGDPFYYWAIVLDGVTWYFKNLHMHINILSYYTLTPSHLFITRWKDYYYYNITCNLFYTAFVNSINLIKILSQISHR